MRFCAALVGLRGLDRHLATYVITAITLGAIAVNGSFAETAEGVPIYLRTNGVHAELILPTRAGNTDWSVEYPPCTCVRSPNRSSGWHLGGVIAVSLRTHPRGPI